MPSKEPRVPVARALIAIVLAVAACSPEPPKPSASPQSPTTQATPPPKVVGDLALEACDPTGAMPCEQQAVVLVEPIAATGLALTYSTEWADGRIDRPTWNANALGLGGWALDVLQRYDPDRRILLSGDGSWRFADAVDIGNGERAVPTYDGFESFVFDGAWRHVRTVDSVTGATLLTMTYDAAGRITGVAGARAGTPVSLTVDRAQDGTIRSLVGPGDTRTAAVMDGADQLAAVGRPDGTILGVAYVEHGLVANWQATGRGQVSYVWDDSGRLTKATDADGVWLELDSEIVDGSTTVILSDPNSGAVTLRSERTGDVLKRTLTDADRTVTQLETSADGSTRLVEPDGTVTTIGAVAHPRWGLAAPVRTPFVETRPDGTEYRVETTTTMATGSPAPAGGQWASQVTINGQPYAATYDPATRLLTTTDPTSRESSWGFDDQGRVTARRMAGTPPVAIAYDSAGFVASVTIGEGAIAATTSYAYDAATGKVVTTLPDGSTTELRVDAYGRLDRATTSEENVELSYDLAGDILQLRSGAHPATSFGYSQAGRATAYVPPAVGDDAWYELTTYTPAGQIATISDQAGVRVELAYDPAGRATSWTFDEGTSTATYDQASGLLASNATPDGVTTTFAYDGWVPTGLAWSGPVDGDVRMSVNGLLQATEVSVNGGPGLPMSYEGSGLLRSIAGLQIERDAASGLPTRSTLGDVVTVFEYDASLRLVASTTTSGGQPVLAVRYVRDLLGRVTRVDRTDAEGTVTTTAFGYDASGRLGSYQRGATTTTYEYDAAGNRVRTTRGDATTIEAVDDRDRLTRQGQLNYRHSPDGTLLERTGSKGSTAYAFDDLGALRSVVLPDGRRIEYVIDAGGRRIGRLVDGVLTDGYLYGVDDTIVAWTDGSGRVRAQFAYDDADRLALVRRDGGDLLVVTDQLGSPIALLDGESGGIVADAAYDAWGNPIGDALTGVPFGFAGGLVDPDTGLVHFGARDYDPATGRWTAPDPLRYEGGDSNLYRYAGGDPVNSVDPTGTTARAIDSGGSDGPIAGTRRGHGAGGGSRGGHPTRTSPYRDAGPTHGPRGPVSPGTSRAPGDWHYPGPGWHKPTPPDGVEPPVNPNTHPMTWCVFGCYTPGEGADTRTPARPDTCIGYCKETPNRVTCYGICGGGSPGKDEFTCIVYCVFGEPHLVTADGGRVDLQVAGEFVIARSPDGAFEIQARFEPSRVVRTVTMTTAVSMKVGPDRVAFYRDPDSGDPSLAMIVNDQPIDRAQYSTTLPGGGVVERLGANARVVWPDGTQLGVDLYAKFMNFSMQPEGALAASLVGLLGGRDGNVANDLTTRDGPVLDPESAGFQEQLHGPFADSWRIAQVDSLFDYREGETTDTFQLIEVPAEHVTVDDLDPRTRADAEALCRAMGVTSDPVLANCIFDVGMTGDPSFAGSAATVATSIDRANVPALDLGTGIGREQRVTGNLVAGAVDRYHFSAAAGDIVYLDADAACDPALSWRLLQPNGSLFWFTDACTDLGRRVLPEAGEWRVEVYSDGAAAGAYAFQVRSVAAPTERSISLGGSASGTTTTIGEWHRYTLDVSAGQVVYLDAEATCDPNLSWRVLRPGGSLFWFATTCTDLGRLELPEDGRWVIEVYSDGLDVGAYSFRVIDVPRARESAIDVGDAVDDATTAVGEWHRYTLTATAGEVIYFDAGATCDPDVSWRLLYPNGSLFWFATTCVDLGRQVLPEAGEWMIEVYSDDLDVGAYSFRLIAAPAVRVEPAALGRKVSDAIDAIGEWHRYRLSADAGDRIVIDAGTTCVAELYWRLLRPDGSLSTFATTCTDSDVRTLEVGGDWLIEVYADTMATGAYEFTVKAAP